LFHLRLPILPASQAKTPESKAALLPSSPSFAVTPSRLNNLKCRRV
jgi:hypothetical protein